MKFRTMELFNLLRDFLLFPEISYNKNFHHIVIVRKNEEENVFSISNKEIHFIW